MKSRLTILCAVVAMGLSGGGCAMVPTWMLKGHVAGYNALHRDATVSMQQMTTDDVEPIK